MAVLKAQTGQVDQETQGKYQSEANRVTAAEAQLAAAQTNVKQTKIEQDRARSLADRE